MNNVEWGQFKRVHCVGIGGIGVSALAKLLHLRGLHVTGSEKHVFEVVDDVRALGIPVNIGFAAENITADVDVVIYSDAFRDGNGEVVAAQHRNIPTYSYNEMLGILSRGSTLFAITGTNGKSTTTSMLAKILEHAEMDPTVVVGSKVPGFQYGNLRVGTPDLWVVEADDYREHFLSLAPRHAIINDVELDHLDYYPDIASVEKAFIRFVKQVDPLGTVVLYADNPRTLALKQAYPRAVTFCLDGQADYVAYDVRVEHTSDGPRTVFQVRAHGEDIGQIQLRVPGRFNAANALAALAMAYEQHIAFATIKQALEAFTGIWRRFEVIGTEPVVVSDYAHHPTAIRPTIAAAREFYPDARVVAVFQPHQEDRLRALFDAFVESFDAADVVILAPVFKASGRESGEPMSSQNLAEAIQLRDAMRGVRRTVLAFGTNEAAIAWLTTHGEKNDCILMMTAGELYAGARDTYDHLRKRLA